MPWAGQWSILVDAAHELNSITTGGNLTTVCPEVDWDHEQTVKLVPLDGDYPAYVGMQPLEGNYTLLIAMKPCTEAVWATQLAQIKGWLAYGQHTLTFQVRGMAAAKTVTVVVRSIATNFANRSLTVLTTAPKPVLA